MSLTRKNKKIPLFKTERFRIFLIFIVPLIFFILVFPIKGEVKEFNGGWTFREDDPSPKTLIRNIIESPFNLKWYIWCIDEVNFGIDIINSTNNETLYHKDLIIEKLNVIITEGYKSKNISLNKGERHCEKFNLEGGFSFEFDADTSTFYDSKLYEFAELDEEGVIKNLRPSFNFTQGVRVEFWTYITKLILTYFSFWAIIILISALIKWYKSKKK